jgi:hypothetical protein
MYSFVCFSSSRAYFPFTHALNLNICLVCLQVDDLADALRALFPQLAAAAGKGARHDPHAQASQGAASAAAASAHAAAAVDRACVPLAESRL